jgi:YggT family protein
MSYLLRAIYYSLYVMEMVLFLRIILSWFRINQDNLFVSILITLTEPLLAPIRKLIDLSIFGARKGGMLLDISPLIAFIFLQTLQNFLVRFL